MWPLLIPTGEIYPQSSRVFSPRTLFGFTIVSATCYWFLYIYWYFLKQMLSEGAVSTPAATISDPGKASFPGFLTLAFWRLYKTQVLLWQLLKSVMFWKKQLGNLCVCILGGHMENRKHCIKYNILKTFICNQPYLGLPRKVRSPAGGAVGGCGLAAAHTACQASDLLVKGRHCQTFQSLQ